MRLSSQRHLFDMPEDVAYLNCAYMSPLLKSVIAAGEAGLRAKATPWKIAPEDFFSDTDVARGLFAGLIGATAGDIAIIPSVSYGIATAALNLPLRTDQHILLIDEEFPADVYAWQGSRVTVPRPADHDWTSALLNAITPQTGIVVAPNCHWTDGGLIDLVRVGERARRVGAALVVDATQSLGANPLDVRTVQPDFLVVANYKWLLCPYTTGFLYVAPRHHNGTPLEQTWLGRGGSENFATLVSYRSDYQAGARRFDMGERSNFAAMPAVICALRQIMEWGVSNISETLAELTAQIAIQAGYLGCDLSPANLRANHMLGLRLPRSVPADLATRLAASQVYVSQRGSAIRVSPHLYNTEADIQHLFDALRRNI